MLPQRNLERDQFNETITKLKAELAQANSSATAAKIHCNLGFLYEGLGFSSEKKDEIIKAIQHYQAALNLNDRRAITYLRKLKDRLMELNEPNVEPFIERIRQIIIKAQTVPVANPESSFWGNMMQKFSQWGAAKPTIQTLPNDIYDITLPYLNHQDVAAWNCTNRFFATHQSLAVKATKMQFQSYCYLKYFADKTTKGISCLLINERLYIYGENTKDSLGVENASLESIPFFNENGRKAIKFFLYPRHLFVLCKNINTNKNELYALGENREGRLGLGNKSTVLEPPVLEPPVLEPPVLEPQRVNLPNGGNPIEVTGDGYSTFVLCDDGKIYSFGRNNFNQLGLGHRKKVCSPQQIPLPSGEKAVKIEIVEVAKIGSPDIKFNAFILCKSGALYRFDEFCSGPAAFSHQNQRIRSLTTSDYGHHMLCEDGSVYSYSRKHGMSQRMQPDKNDIPQMLIDDLLICKNGMVYFVDKNIIKKLDGLPENKKVRQVLRENHATYIFYQDGDLYAYGNNRNQQLGIPNDETSHAMWQKDPKKVLLPCGEVPYKMSASGEGIILYCESGSIYAFGKQNYENLLWTQSDDGLSIAKCLRMPSMENKLENWSNVRP